MYNVYTLRTSIHYKRKGMKGENKSFECSIRVPLAYILTLRTFYNGVQLLLRILGAVYAFYMYRMIKAWVYIIHCKFIYYIKRDVMVRQEGEYISVLTNMPNSQCLPVVRNSHPIRIIRLDFRVNSQCQLQLINSYPCFLPLPLLQ